MKIYAPGDEHDDMADSLALAIAAKSGNRYVERQKKFYSFRDSDYEGSSDKRAYTF